MILHEAGREPDTAEIIFYSSRGASVVLSDGIIFHKS